MNELCEKNFYTFMIYTFDPVQRNQHKNLQTGKSRSLTHARTLSLHQDSHTRTLLLLSLTHTHARTFLCLAHYTLLLSLHLKLSVTHDISFFLSITHAHTHNTLIHPHTHAHTHTRSLSVNSTDVKSDFVRTEMSKLSGNASLVSVTVVSSRYSNLQDRWQRWSDQCSGRASSVQF